MQFASGISRENVIVSEKCRYLLGAFPKAVKSDFFLSIDLSVCSTAYIGAAPTAQIFVKFVTGDFHKNLPRKIQIWLKSDNNIRHFA
jgi:hypothetical protein